MVAKPTANPVGRPKGPPAPPPKPFIHSWDPFLQGQLPPQAFEFPRSWPARGRRRHRWRNDFFCFVVRMSYASCAVQTPAIISRIWKHVPCSLVPRAATRCARSEDSTASLARGKSVAAKPKTLNPVNLKPQAQPEASKPKTLNPQGVQP